jgi:hypothetical protein
MLHPINPSGCVNELLELVNLQRKMLEFAEANSVYSDARLRSFMPNEFVDWIIILRTGSSKGAKTANRFVQELTEYVKFPQSDKRQVLADFILDQEYYTRINDSTFAFSLLPSKSNAHEVAKKCLCEYYDFLGEGYPSELVGHSVGEPAFMKEDVVSGYKSTNPNIEYVCPSCDQAFTDSPAGNEEGYTLDHFFPKSLYPAICLHPLNLIPMCSGCNHKKGQLDPLNPSVMPIIKVLYEESFHPVARSVRQHTDLGFLARASVPDEMKFISSNPPPTYANAIEAYRILYQIPSRWEVNWKRVDKQINSYLNRAVRNLNSQAIDEQLFHVALDEAIRDLEGEVGQNHLCYPAVKWLSWARVNRFQTLMNSFVMP